MRNNIFVFTCACLLIIVGFSSCHTTQKASLTYKSARPPKFIKGMYLNGHNKSNATANAIEPTKAPVKKPVENAVEPVVVVNTTIADTRQESQPTLPPKKNTQQEDQTFDLVSDNLVRQKYAEMIGMDGKDISNHQLYMFIDRWYGTNYRLGGQTTEGIDCSGFAQKLYTEVYGLDLTRTAMEQYQNCKRDKNCENAEEGDLVFFKQRSKRITHVGVYLANNYFVHSSTSQGVTISSLKDEYWHKHYVGIGKLTKGD